MNFMGMKKTFFSISSIIIIIGLVTMLVTGLNQDIDFAGGTAMHVNIGKTFDNKEIRAVVSDTIGVDPSTVQKVGDGTEVIIKTKEIDTVQRDKVFQALKEKYNLQQDDLFSTDNVSPTIGSELRSQAFLASLIASVLMLAYITIRFEFKSGIAAVIALIHDILVMLTVYAVFKVPVNTSFIAAILTILGYSINDTIIVFDRIRENRKYMRKEAFSDVVNKSIWQTMARSINTSLTTLLTISALYVLGVQSIKEFAFPLIVGILSGTYSSIFIASPVWVMWKEWQKDKKTKLKNA
ncbi:protein translocase subunit SecF [Petroclostridium sp. X23]|uniref:protein translocase subunit SecF n=1 Tax=Petroclostridium sp. X23 TaxID=3045146 RepID=UPI0024ADD783|nr:protein translocase subunit SecF [Petroclostridium sp. X23]WHH59055.1 protein translocase subunit SecF [Petroclostridium sp. X23]